jgi:hypothetical protein
MLLRYLRLLIGLRLMEGSLLELLLLYLLLNNRLVVYDSLIELLWSFDTRIQLVVLHLFSIVIVILSFDCMSLEFFLSSSDFIFFPFSGSFSWCEMPFIKTRLWHINGIGLLISICGDYYRSILYENRFAI